MMPRTYAKLTMALCDWNVMPIYTYSGSPRKAWERDWCNLKAPFIGLTRSVANGRWQVLCRENAESEVHCIGGSADFLPAFTCFMQESLALGFRDPADAGRLRDFMNWGLSQ